MRVPRPTTCRPGPDKVEVLAARYAARLPLWHLDDATNDGRIASELPVVCEESGVRVVTWRNRTSYMARVQVNKKRKTLGLYATASDAAEAVKQFKETVKTLKLQAALTRMRESKK